MLITYSDSMGHNLADLNEILDKYFKDAVNRKKRLFMEKAEIREVMGQEITVQM